MALTAKKLLLSSLFIILGSSLFAGPKNWNDAKEYTPIQQEQFCQLTDSFREDLIKAQATQNDIKVNMVKKDRHEDLDALLPRGKFKDWIVKTKSITQVDNGDVAVVFELNCLVSIGSSKFVVEGTSRWAATIEYNSREYNQLAKLSANEFAIISGSFIRINQFVKNQKESYYASRPLDSGENAGLGEFFLANLTYIASAN